MPDVPHQLLLEVFDRPKDASCDDIALDLGEPEVDLVRTIVDATIISAPSSTKNRTKERDPEMHQTKKGNQWYFGMKAHIGVDSQTKLVHSVVATAAAPMAAPS